MNTILMITKQYIFTVSLNLERRPRIYELKDLIKKTILNNLKWQKSMTVKTNLIQNG